MGEHAVTLIFELNEEVTPEIFVRKVADACSHQGAIRPGEIVRTESGVGFRAVEPVMHFDLMPFPVTQWIEATSCP